MPDYRYRRNWLEDRFEKLSGTGTDAGGDARRRNDLARGIYHGLPVVVEIAKAKGDASIFHRNYKSEK